MWGCGGCETPGIERQFSDVITENVAQTPLVRFVEQAVDLQFLLIRCTAVPSAHSASPLLCSCYQPWNSSPLGSIACHSDSQDQAVEAVWSHRSLRPDEDHARALKLRRHRRPAEGMETTAWSSATNVTAHRRAGPQNIGLWAARHTAQDRARWRQVMETAMLCQGLAPWCCVMLYNLFLQDRLSIHGE